jgi:hypothetical protein
MATVVELARAGVLSKIDPALEANEQEWRSIYVLPRCRSRIENDLPNWTSDWKVEETPLQQLDALAEVFCSGVALTFGRRFKPLRPTENGIWELKTADLRIFGWFAARDCFIGGALDLTFNVKNHGLYTGYVGEVVRHRDLLDLNEPKFVPGDNPNDVVSNYDYP